MKTSLSLSGIFSSERELIASEKDNDKMKMSIISQAGFCIQQVRF